MPTYGEGKIRDIAESILPSTARRRAREERKRIHRAERRRVRQAFPDDDLVGNERKVRIELRDMKSERRAADKIRPLMRWAEKTTASIEDPVERYMHVKALMPDNLIGRHALSHVDDIDGIDRPGENPFEYSRYSARYRKPVPRRDWAADLRRVVSDGNQKALNDAVKAVHRRPVRRVITGWETGTPENPKRGRQPVYDYVVGHVVGYRKDRRGWYSHADTIYEPCACAPRTLKGLHDVDQFLADLRQVSMKGTDWQPEVPSHPEWKEAVERFLDTRYPIG